MPKMRGTRISEFAKFWGPILCYTEVRAQHVSAISTALSIKIRKCFVKCLTPSNIGVSYTVGKLFFPTFQCTCKFGETRGTRTCIRVHVMGVPGLSGRGQILALPSLHLIIYDDFSWQNHVVYHDNIMSP